MKEQNMALLGFISSAADYLEDQFNDEKEDIKEIGEIDFEAIKNELANKLDSSFVNATNNSEDYISAGREAFNNYINAKQPGLIEEFEEIFNVDFKKKNEEKERDITNHLMALLSSPEEEPEDKNIKEEPTVEETITIVEDNVAEFEEEKVNEETEVEELTEDELKEDVIDEELIEDEFEEEYPQEEEEFSSDIDEYVKIIAHNVLKPEEEENITIKETEPAMDEVFSEIVSNEPEDKRTISTIISDYKKEEKIQDAYNSQAYFKTGVEKKESEERKIGLLEEFINKMKLDLAEKEAEAEKTPVVETANQKLGLLEEFVKKMKEDMADEIGVPAKLEITNDGKELDDKPKKSKVLSGELRVEPKQEENKKVEEPVHVKETIEVKPEIKEVHHEEEKVNEYNLDTFDLADVLGEEVSDINGEVEEVEEEAETYDYVSQLIEELSKEQLSDKIEKQRAKEEEANAKIYDAIKKMYPYLSDGFIRGVYSLKESLAYDYEEGLDIVLLHRLRFENVDGLRKFVEVVLQHDYSVNVDEVQMIVDAFKEHINTDGWILTDIFEISNQAKVLTGEYEGYRVILNQEG